MPVKPDAGDYAGDVRLVMSRLRECGVTFSSVTAQDGAEEVIRDVIAATYAGGHTDGYYEGWDDGYQAAEQEY